MEEFDIPPHRRRLDHKAPENGSESPKASIYLPERWLDLEGNHDGYAGPMLPFGAGPRG
ncbi:hypothetical protein BJX61DRAFT_530283 [Aspergillus egyptiacus]|nr:hypothetical protein BJX61DRAFT_530283 [Aspergillus egyptiacus]